MRAVRDDAERAVLFLNASERDMLIAVLAAGEVTDPVIMNCEPETAKALRDRLVGVVETAEGFSLPLSQPAFRNICMIVSAVVASGERDAYSAYVNRIQNDETIDALDEAIYGAYRAVYP